MALAPTLFKGNYRPGWQLCSASRPVTSLRCNSRPRHTAHLHSCKGRKLFRNKEVHKRGRELSREFQMRCARAVKIHENGERTSFNGSSHPETRSVLPLIHTFTHTHSHSHTHTHTHTHTLTQRRSRHCHARRWPAHREQHDVQCLAQGHFVCVWESEKRL